MKELQTSNANEHSANIRSGLQEMVDHLRKDIKKVDDLKPKRFLKLRLKI